MARYIEEEYDAQFGPEPAIYAVSLIYDYFKHRSATEGEILLDDDVDFGRLQGELVRHHHVIEKVIWRLDEEYEYHKHQFGGAPYFSEDSLRQILSEFSPHPPLEPQLYTAETLLAAFDYEFDQLASSQDYEGYGVHGGPLETVIEDFPFLSPRQISYAAARIERLSNTPYGHHHLRTRRNSLELDWNLIYRMTGIASRQFPVQDCQQCETLTDLGAFCFDCATDEWPYTPYDDDLWILWKATFHKRKDIYEGMMHCPYTPHERIEPHSIHNWLMSPLGAIKQGTGDHVIAAMVRQQDLYMEPEQVITSWSSVLPLRAFFRPDLPRVEAAQHLLSDVNQHWAEIEEFEAKMRERALADVEQMPELVQDLRERKFS